MSAAAWAAVFGGLSFASTVIGMAFLHGRLTQRVDNTEEQARLLRGEHAKLSVQVQGHEVSLGRLHEWKDGFNAGARKIGSGEARD